MTDSYVDGLTEFRHLGSGTAPLALEGLNTWVGRFAGACNRAVHHAGAYEARAAELEASWRQRLGRVRANSATHRILRILPALRS